MNLAPITQSEVSQKEKDKYRILAHIYGIYKDGKRSYVHIGEQRRHRCKEQTSDTVGGDGRMTEEKSAETHTWPYAQNSRWELEVRRSVTSCRAGCGGGQVSSREGHVLASAGSRMAAGQPVRQEPPPPRGGHPPLALGSVVTFL